jgi:tetratricopeptide (TPR) repeat protein
MAAPAHVRELWGHDIGHSLERPFAGREIRRIVLLREPLSLQLSLYNYRMMNYLAKGQGTYSFALHLRTLPRDFVAHWLLSRWLEIPWPTLMRLSDARKYDMLNRALASFWFVGDYADCDRLIAALAPVLGVPDAAAPRNTAREWQRQVEWRPLRAEELSPVQHAAILARNPIDRALWHSWNAAGFDARRVAPLPLGPAGRFGFIGHEIVRPGFLAARWLRRHGPRRDRVAGIARADHARDAGDWELAARRYRKALADMPNTPAVWVQYGHALKQLGQLAAAEAAYRRSLALDPDAADTHLQLGRILKRQGKSEQAAACLRLALALDAALDAARLELIEIRGS